MIIRSVLVAHLVIGPLLTACTVLAPDGYGEGLSMVLETSVLGVFHSQGCMLGCWAAFSRLAAWKRFIGLCLGLCYLWTLRQTGLQVLGYQPRSICLSFSCPFAFAALMRLFRAYNIRPRRLDRCTFSRAPRKTRISIYQAMALILVIAVWLKLGLSVRTGADRGAVLRDLMMIVVSYVAIGLITFWAILGRGQLTVTVPVIVLVTAAVIWQNIYMLGDTPPDFAIALFWATSLPLVIHAGVMSILFLIVRWFGFRLIRCEARG
jgi:hypothetical protein